MYIPEKMKLNKFKQVSMPSARDYLQSQGERVAAASEYSGDEIDRGTLSKVDSIEDFRRAVADDVEKLKTEEHSEDNK